ncbi:MAG: radical SAM/SPASM domain-containing protein [Actinomycetota bacterium]
MYDIEFFRRVEPLRKKIVERQFTKADVPALIEELEALVSAQPYVFNIETTNYCNMKCVMCPRTTLMTRKNMWIDGDDFAKVISQIKPHDPERLAEFHNYVAERYNVSYDRPDENAFYFHVSSRCLTLHGYGEPMLDKHILERVRVCREHGVPTYFSCVPANATVARVEELMQAGLDVLKFSVDALDDEQQKKVRGARNNFDAAFQTILDILELKKAKGYQTLIVVTMIELSTDAEAQAMHQRFLDLWKGRDVFAYIKSQDNRWYFEADENLENRSHYEQQYCEYPWTSFTVMADGSVVPCTQDYDVEMVLGNVREQTLEEIWNGERYRTFRSWHVSGNFPKGHKCAERCDQKKLCGYLKP